ncbi:hypothetical protein Q8G35_12565 [Peribacillus simplex]|uniref:Uncharacterized protein n=2 Tax=Peribacillus TaxID=2675229 RepID=A0AA90PAI8_9BACI|nr:MULTISPECIES: hypothetical protein [Peribacillus]MDP1419244.1 hypothetical protein [Peribacillus simplex]MDP1452118.1 hypothetical protein [Peribacillus frigoritolerans]
MDFTSLKEARQYLVDKYDMKVSDFDDMYVEEFMKLLEFDNLIIKMV